MSLALKNALVSSLFALAICSTAFGQRPTPQQIEKAVNSNPTLTEKVRSKIASSGMTPDQIRARLKSSGYPEHMLDAYLTDASGRDSSSSLAPDVLRAVAFLGLIDSTEIASRTDTLLGSRRDSVGTRSDSSNRVFGLDIFRRSTSQFEPDVAGPVDPSYRVGPRDILALILTGGVENSYTLEVTREGFVVVPQVGQIYVANLTLEQIERVFYDRLKSAYSGLRRDGSGSTRFYVTVARLRTNQVFVVGEVLSPGSYQVSSAGTMLTALYAAGGPTDKGSLRQVELRRAGKVVSQLDVYSYLLSGDAAKDARMETGDVLFVGAHGPRVRISGNVVRPADYELRDGETLRDLIRMSGGFTATAERRRLLVRRIVPPAQRTSPDLDRTVIDVASDEFTTGEAPDLPLANGDNVEVFGITSRERNSIYVQGAVYTPGAQGFTRGMRLSDALQRAGGVHPDVKDVLISRLQSDLTRSQLRAGVRDTLGHPTNDVALQEDDSITVFGTSDFRPDRGVAITGAVRNGGRFPYQEGMTLRDLVHLAGGLDDGAYLVRAEVARLPEKRVPGIVATDISVPLDSSYVLERGLTGKYTGPRGADDVIERAPDFMLQPYDNVLILRQPEWQTHKTVQLVGEVMFPGAYTLLSKQDRLSDVIARAGGLTKYAYAEGVVFIRDTDHLGRVGVDLPTALRDPHSRQNILLEPGDSISIPSFKPVVKVEGAVNSPVAVAYRPGADLDYYIDAAGGETYNADKARAYVRQPNGDVERIRTRWSFIPDAVPEPRPGAVVVVPASDPTQRRDWTAVAGSVAQIVVSIAGVVAIALRK